MSGLHPSIRDYGDQAVLLEWAVSGYDETVSSEIHSLAARLRQSKDFIEVMPGYDSLVVSFDCANLTAAAAERRIKNALVEAARDDRVIVDRMIEIPVHYGGVNGPDLDAMADQIGMSADELVSRHSERDYRVCMMGFIPGFAFLSDVDPALQHPRHDTPRAAVPAGSVGIANWQTGIYGLDSPGGWQIIGRTDLTLFDASRKTPFLLEAGDRIRFVPK